MDIHKVQLSEIELRIVMDSLASERMNIVLEESPDLAEQLSYIENLEKKLVAA